MRRRGETAEEQSDDEVRTSQIPERREGKTKVTKDYIYCLWHLSNFIYWSSLVCLCFAITPSTCSIYQLNRIKPRVNHFDPLRGFVLVLLNIFMVISFIYLRCSLRVMEIKIEDTSQ